jgi:hypothetical protein
MVVIKMGSYFSYQLDCPKCKYEKAEFVFKEHKSPRMIPQLNLWFNGSFLCKSLYISCRECLSDIPDEYRNYFEYNKE